MVHSDDLINRFFDKVSYLGENDCWEWKASRNHDGYGGFRYNGKFIRAHRASWILHYGEIPEGMWVCHHCDNPGCVNPKHLFLGTPQDNVADRERKGRNKMPNCRGEEHGGSKLTEDDVHEIRFLYGSSDYSYRVLALLYGVTFGAIRDVITGRNWSWLDIDGSV